MSEIISDRRLFLKRVLTGTIAAATLIPDLRSTRAGAASLASQQAANYVNHSGPGGEKCGNCQFFVANTSHPSLGGTCTAVAGSISPDGYCPYFSAKS